jgi:hypothetical protein
MGNGVGAGLRLRNPIFGIKSRLQPGRGMDLMELSGPPEAKLPAGLARGNSVAIRVAYQPAWRIAASRKERIRKWPQNALKIFKTLF